MELFVKNNIVANSKAGFRHKIRNEASQDDFHVAELSNGVKIVAVCDGCSSASFAKYGAKIASLQAVTFAKNFPMLHDVLEDDKVKGVFVDGLIASIRGRIEDFCKSFGKSPAAFASTLLFCVFFEGRYLAVQLGDGAIVISKQMKMELLPTKIPKSQKGNVTYSTCDLFFTESFDEILTVNIGEADAIFLMTDGMKPLFDPVLDIEALYAMVMANNFYAPDNRIDMAERLVEVCAAHTMDDSTFVCITKKTCPYDLDKTNRSRLFGEEQTCKSRCSKFRKRNLRRSIRFYQFLNTERTRDELVEKLRFSPSLVSRIGNKLENLGLIERRGDSYRRTNRS